MPDNSERPAACSRHPIAAEPAPPEWFCRAGVAAMFLLVAVRVDVPGGAWLFPLFSLGEWLLIPLGAAALAMGLLPLNGVRGVGLPPRWLPAVVPAALWLAAAGVSIFRDDASGGGDMLLSWFVRLVLPAMAFLPLLVRTAWRDRLLWALAAGLTLNVLFVLWQSRAAADGGMLGRGGLLAGQHDYGALAAAALPLLAAWRGGGGTSNRALAVLYCTFLLPALVLASLYSWGGVAAAAAGLAVAWTSRRSYGWIPGVFLCLLVFGHGADDADGRDAAFRRRLAASAGMGAEQYRKALDAFGEKPYFGRGPGSFAEEDGGRRADATVPRPWYATLLGGTGLAGLGLWLVLLGELASRALGRNGGRCLLCGGVLGGAAGLAVAGLWTDVLARGAGAMVGVLLAFSILDEEAPAAPPKRPRLPPESRDAPPPARAGNRLDQV